MQEESFPGLPPSGAPLGGGGGLRYTFGNPVRSAWAQPQQPQQPQQQPQPSGEGGWRTVPSTSNRPAQAASSSSSGGGSSSNWSAAAARQNASIFGTAHSLGRTPTSDAPAASAAATKTKGQKKAAAKQRKAQEAAATARAARRIAQADDEDDEDDEEQLAAALAASSVRAAAPPPPPPPRASASAAATSGLVLFCGERGPAHRAARFARRGKGTATWGHHSDEAAARAARRDEPLRGG